MRSTFRLVTFFLLFASAVSQAQVSRPPFTLAKIDGPIIKQFQRAWHTSGNGLSDAEGLVLLFANPDGSHRAKTMGSTHESYAVTFKWDPETITVVHTHPTRSIPEPQGLDIALADRFGVPIFTLTFKGMFMYDPKTKRISKIKDGLDWLEPSHWTQQRYTATDRSDFH